VTEGRSGRGRCVLSALTSESTATHYGPTPREASLCTHRFCAEAAASGTVILPGVEIGEEAFVAADALATRDVPRRAVVMGVPARVVRDVLEAHTIQRLRRPNTLKRRQSIVPQKVAKTLRV